MQSGDHGNKYLLQLLVELLVALIYWEGVHTLAYTVKLVYKDHPGDQQHMVLIPSLHRWSL